MTYLFLGLGNMGVEYAETRHNIGWLFLDFVARKNEAGEFTLDKKSQSYLTKTKLEIQAKNSPVILAKPTTYVNTTGPVVAKLKTLNKLKPEHIIIIQDDLDIDFGSFKLSFDRNSGGHRGVESIIKALKTKAFWRLRFGTRNSKLKKAYALPEKKKDDFIKDFVLAKFTPSEKEELKPLFKSALERLAQKTQ